MFPLLRYLRLELRLEAYLRLLNINHMAFGSHKRHWSPFRDQCRSSYDDLVCEITPVFIHCWMELDVSCQHHVRYWEPNDINEACVGTGPQRLSPSLGPATAWEQGGTQLGLIKGPSPIKAARIWLMVLLDERLRAVRHSIMFSLCKRGKTMFMAGCFQWGHGSKVGQSDSKQL